jgi:hypothetical protein
MNIQGVAWGILAGSLLVAVIVDWAVVQLLLEFLKPTSAYVFWIGRAGKIAAVVAWVLFFNEFWYPQFVSSVQPVPGWGTALEWGLVAVLGIAAFATLPRAPRRRG